MEQFRSDERPGGFIGVASDTGSGSDGGTSSGGGGATRSRPRIGSARPRTPGSEGRINTGADPQTPEGDVLGAFIGRSRDNTPEDKKRVAGAPSGSQPRGKATKEDETDLTLLITNVSSGAAVATGFLGWIFTEEEARAIAEPASRILARHKVVQGYVRDVADPLSLCVAIGLPTYVRWLAYRQWLRESRMVRVAQAQADPTASNGVAGPSVVDRMRSL